jgi:hypothetical protein
MHHAPVIGRSDDNSQRSLISGTFFVRWFDGIVLRNTPAADPSEMPDDVSERRASRRPWRYLEPWYLAYSILGLMQGFHLAARILDFPGSVPGDVGLFLAWGE